MRKINKLIVHCSATPEGKDYTVEQIREWHVKNNGWKDIGYHYVIYRDGSIHTGRPVEQIGAHCAGYNANSIGICYIGGVTSNNKPKDTRTEAQKQSLVKLLKELKAKYPNATIHGHREFANKACPCFDAKYEYKDL
jgi:N-acetylmuramoyl-L-alanine amidase